MSPFSPVVPYMFRSPVVDLMTVATHNLDTPVVGGMRFVPAGRMRVQINDRDAAATQELIFDLAQNGTAINASVTGLKVAVGAINVAAQICPDNAAGVLPLPDMSAHPLQFKITTGVGGAGMTSCNGRLLIPGYYEPTP